MRNEYPDEFEAFSESHTRTWYRFGAGLDRALDLAPVYDRFGHLFGRDEIAALGEAAENGFGELDRKEARYLRAAAIEEHLSSATRELDEIIADRDAAETVAWEGETLPFHSLRSRIRNESRPEVRSELARRRERIVEGSNDMRAERLDKRAAAARSLGAVSTAALCSDVYGIDYTALRDRASVLLSETEASYAAALASLVRKRSTVDIGDATREDLLYALRFAEFDEAFPAHRMPMVYRDVFAGLGIKTGAQRNIRLDLEDRPSKNPRPFCAPIRVPDDVVLVVRPSGGYADYTALLHEGGHAQHFGFTSPGARVAFARAGDRATSETWAFLVQYLLLDDRYLREAFHIDPSSELRRLAAIEKCSVVRRHVGKLRYEEALHSGRLSLGSAPAAYVEELEGATMVRYPRSDALSDLDDGFYVADYLRAWALEVLVREHLKTRFGNRWWSSRAAGALLRELWATGSEYSADEIAAELGLGPICFEPLADDLRRGMAA